MIVSVCFIVSTICYLVLFSLLRKTNRIVDQKQLLIEIYRLEIEGRDHIIKFTKAQTSFLRGAMPPEEFDKELRLLEANRHRTNTQVEKLMEELD